MTSPTPACAGEVCRATPSLHVDYKHSRIKQYHIGGTSLCTETVINDKYDIRCRPPAEQPQ